MKDLVGSWKMKSNDMVFQIEQIDEENFKVMESDTNKEYEFHLSLGGKNDGHILSSDSFWNEKLIFFNSEDSFVLTGQFQSQSWCFERNKKFEQL